MWSAHKCHKPETEMEDRSIHRLTWWGPEQSKLPGMAMEGVTPFPLHPKAACITSLVAVMVLSA